MQDINAKVVEINERVARTEEKVDALLAWKDKHEIQDAHMFNKLETKQELVRSQLSAEIAELQQDIGDLKLETIGVLNSLRQESAERHIKLLDRLTAMSIKVSWMIGVGVGAMAILSILISLI